MTEKASSNPNSNIGGKTIRRTRVGVFVGVPVIALGVACGHNSIISTTVTSDELAAIMAEGCPVDDKFSLEKTTLTLVDSMEPPAPVGEKKRQLYAQNLYNAVTPDASEPVPIVGGVDSRTGESANTSLFYNLDGKVVKAKTVGGEMVCALAAGFSEYIPPSTVAPAT